jgi:hypothetical protein
MGRGGVALDVKGRWLGVVGRWQLLHLRFLQGTGEICLCWYDEITALAIFL